MDTRSSLLVQHLVPQQRMSNRAGMLSYLRKFPRLSDKERQDIASRVIVERGRLKDRKVECPSVEEVMLEKIFKLEELEHLMGDDLDHMGRLALLLQQESWTTKAVAEARLHFEISSEMWGEALSLARKAKGEAQSAALSSPEPEMVVVPTHANGFVQPDPDKVLRTQSLALIAQGIPADEAWRILAPSGEKDEFNSRYVGWGGAAWTVGVGVGTLRGKVAGEAPIKSSPKKKRERSEKSALVVRRRRPLRKATPNEEVSLEQDSNQEEDPALSPQAVIVEPVVLTSDVIDLPREQEVEVPQVETIEQVIDSLLEEVEQTLPQEVGREEEEVFDPNPEPVAEPDVPTEPAPESEAELDVQPEVETKSWVLQDDRPLEGPPEQYFCPQPDLVCEILRFPDDTWGIEGGVQWGLGSS